MKRLPSTPLTPSVFQFVIITIKSVLACTHGQEVPACYGQFTRGGYMTCFAFSRPVTATALKLYQPDLDLKLAYSRTRFFKGDSLLDWQPTGMAKNQCYVLILHSSSYETNSSILNQLQPVQQLTTNTSKHAVAVVQSAGDEGMNRHPCRFPHRLQDDL